MKQPLAVVPLKGSRSDRAPFVSSSLVGLSPGAVDPNAHAWGRLMQGWDRGLCWVERKMMLAVGLLIFTLMVLVSCDALLRYSLNRPLVFTVDVAVLYLLPGTLFLALPFTLRRGGHISVDLFASMMPLRVHQVIMGCALLGATVIIGMMTWEIIGIAHDSWVLSLFASGPYPWPLWVSEAGVAFSVLVLTLRLLQMAVGNLWAGIAGCQAAVISVSANDEQSQEEDL